MQRFPSSSRIAEGWISKALKRPGRLHDYFGIPEGETIPVGKIKAEISKLHGKEVRTPEETSLLRALNLGLTLKKQGTMNRNLQADLKSDITQFLKSVSGYDFFHEILTPPDDLDAEKYAPEIGLIESFFKEIEKVKYLPQVGELISSVRDTEHTRVPYKGAGDLAKSIAKYVGSLGEKYQSKFRPEVLREIRKGSMREVFRPTKIQDFVGQVNKYADLLAKGRLGIPLFLGLFGVSTSAYQRRASLTEEQVRIMSKRIAKKVDSRSRRSSLIRLASSLPAGGQNKKAILAGLRAPHPLSLSAAETALLRDPETGLSAAELQAQIDALGWSEANSYKKKTLARILDRLIMRQKKRDRGLRLSPRPKDVAGLIGQKGQWGYEGKWDTWTQHDMGSSYRTPYAVLQGGTVVGWVIKVEQSVRDTKGMSYGGTTVQWSDYTAYSLEGKKIGYGGSKSSERPLDDMAEYLKSGKHQRGLS